MSDQAYKQIFFPLVQFLRFDRRSSDKVQWLVVVADGKRVVNCSETRMAGDRDESYMRLRAWWEQGKLYSRIQPLSSKLFANQGPYPVFALSTDRGALDSVRSWIQEEKLYPDVAKCTPMIDQGISNELTRVYPTIVRQLQEREYGEADKTLKRLLPGLKKGLGPDNFWNPYSDLYSLDRLIRYFAWLYFHDTDAKLWLYLREPQPRTMGHPKSNNSGVICCFSEAPEKSLLSATYHLTGNYFELARLTRRAAKDRTVFPLYLRSSAGSVHAKDLLLESLEKVEETLRIPAIAPDEARRDFRPELETVLYPIYPLLTQIRDFKWISIFEWDEPYKELRRVGWAIGRGGEDITKPDYWEKMKRDHTRFQKQADEINSLEKRGEIVLLGKTLFAYCQDKRPVVILCQADESRSLDEIMEVEPGHRALQTNHKYVYICFNKIMQGLLQILGDAPNGPINVCYERLSTGAWEPVQRIGQEVFGIMEEQLKLTLPKGESKVTFCTKLFKHLIWVLLHEPQPGENSLKALAYFPSKIKPNTPSGGALVAFAQLPKAEDLLLLDDYMTNYFMAKSLLASQFEVEFPCVYTNAAFERNVYSAVREQMAQDGCILAIAFIDMDGLKQINDNTEQHIYGTMAIRAFTEAITEQLMKSGLQPHICGRYGGDEFLIAYIQRVEAENQDAILINKKPAEENLVKFLADLRSNMTSSKDFKRLERAYNYFLAIGVIDEDRTPRSLLDKVKLRFTAGVASVHVGKGTKDGRDCETPVGAYGTVRNRADRTMYLAKLAGRNIDFKASDLQWQTNEGSEVVVSLRDNEFERQDEELKRRVNAGSILTVLHGTIKKRSGASLENSAFQKLVWKIAEKLAEAKFSFFAKSNFPISDEFHFVSFPKSSTDEKKIMNLITSIYYYDLDLLRMEMNCDRTIEETLEMKLGCLTCPPYKGHSKTGEGDYVWTRSSPFVV